MLCLPSPPPAVTHIQAHSQSEDSYSTSAAYLCLIWSYPDFLDHEPLVLEISRNSSTLREDALSPFLIHLKTITLLFVGYSPIRNQKFKRKKKKKMPCGVFNSTATLSLPG